MDHIIWRLRFSNYYTRIDGKAFEKGFEIIQSRPGIFGISLDEHKASTFLIPGFASHAFYSISGSLGIIEMTHKGLTKSRFFDVCKEADRVLLMDCVLWDQDHRELMMKRAIEVKAVPYDVEFKFGTESFYCSELVFHLDEGNRLQADTSDLMGLGREYISPDGLLFAENARCLWDSDGVFDGMTGPDIEAYLRSDLRL